MRVLGKVFSPWAKLSNRYKFRYLNFWLFSGFVPLCGSLLPHMAEISVFYPIRHKQKMPYPIVQIPNRCREAHNLTFTFLVRVDIGILSFLGGHVTIYDPPPPPRATLMYPMPLCSCPALISWLVEWLQHSNRLVYVMYIIGRCSDISHLDTPVPMIPGLSPYGTPFGPLMCPVE